LATIGQALADMGCNNAYLYGEPTLALGPEHAAILAAGGYDKRAIKEHIFANARIPRAIWLRGGMAGMFDDHFPDAQMLPIIRASKDLIIIVVGGFGRHSCWLPTFGASTRAVTRLIARGDGSPLASVQDFLD
jgi:hypothetical protein